MLDGKRPELPSHEVLPGPDRPSPEALEAYCRLVRWVGPLGAPMLKLWYVRKTRPPLLLSLHQGTDATCLHGRLKTCLVALPWLVQGLLEAGT